jgi:hypothetical protein
VITPVNLCWTTSRTMEDVRSWFQLSVTSSLRKAGYRVSSDTVDELVMRHPASSQWWLILVSFWAFWLSGQRQYQVVFKFVHLVDGRSQVLIIGDVPGKLAEILEDLARGAHVSAIKAHSRR